MYPVCPMFPMLTVFDQMEAYYTRFSIIMRDIARTAIHDFCLRRPNSTSVLVRARKTPTGTRRTSCSALSWTCVRRN